MRIFIQYKDSHITDVSVENGMEFISFDNIDGEAMKDAFEYVSDNNLNLDDMVLKDVGNTTEKELVLKF